MLPPVVAVVLLIAIVAYFLASRRAMAIAGGRSAELHSRPGYYASYAALIAAGRLWRFGRWHGACSSRWCCADLVLRSAPPDVTSQSPESVGFFMSAVRRIADGLPPAGEIPPAMQAAADYYGTLLTFSGSHSWSPASPWRPSVCRRPCATSSATFARATRSSAGSPSSCGSRPASRSPRPPGSSSRSCSRSIPLLPEGAADRVPVRAAMEPAVTLRADQVGSTGAFGAVPSSSARLLITLIAMLVAGPIGMFSAIYLSVCQPDLPRLGQADPRGPGRHPDRGLRLLRRPDRGPTNPQRGRVDRPGRLLGECAPAGLVMGIMIIPFVSSLADDAISAVPTACATRPMGSAPRARKPSSRC